MIQTVFLGNKKFIIVVVLHLTKFNYNLHAPILYVKDVWSLKIKSIQIKSDY